MTHTSIKQVIEYKDRVFGSSKKHNSSNETSIGLLAALLIAQAKLHYNKTLLY